MNALWEQRPLGVFVQVGLACLGLLSDRRRGAARSWRQDAPEHLFRPLLRRSVARFLHPLLRHGRAHSGDDLLLSPERFRPQHHEPVLSRSRLRSRDHRRGAQGRRRRHADVGRRRRRLVDRALRIDAFPDHRRARGPGLEPGRSPGSRRRGRTRAPSRSRSWSTTCPPAMPEQFSSPTCPVSPARASRRPSTRSSRRCIRCPAS